MFDRLWTAVEQSIISVLVTAIPIAGAWLIAWLRRKHLETIATKQVVAEVERTASTRPGAEKQALALARLADVRPSLPPVRARKIIEQVLPGVRASLRPPPVVTFVGDRPPPPPPSRRLPPF